jgi:hypothetical protein
VADTARADQLSFFGIVAGPASRLLAGDPVLVTAEAPVDVPSMPLEEREATRTGPASRSIGRIALAAENGSDSRSLFHQ